MYLISKLLSAKYATQKYARYSRSISMESSWSCVYRICHSPAHLTIAFELVFIFCCTLNKSDTFYLFTLHTHRHAQIHNYTYKTASCSVICLQQLPLFGLGQVSLNSR